MSFEEHSCFAHCVDSRRPIGKPLQGIFLTEGCHVSATGQRCVTKVLIRSSRRGPPGVELRRSSNAEALTDQHMRGETGREARREGLGWTWRVRRDVCLGWATIRTVLPGGTSKLAPLRALFEQNTDGNEVIEYKTQYLAWGGVHVISKVQQESVCVLCLSCV